MNTVDLAAPIQLAHEPAFTVGLLRVLPATRELQRADGASEIIEPRVMQVLVALCRADGHVVSRHDLTQSFWDGVVVGEDSINRVMSRLRRVAERLGEGSFRVETVTKVGYRLLAPDQDAEAKVIQPPGLPAATQAASGTERRALLVGAGALATSAASWGAWHVLSRRPSRPVQASSAATALISQGLVASLSGTSEGLEQAIGFFRRATELDPGNADAWGALAMAYASSGFTAAPDEQLAARARAHNALDRARQIDPANAYAAIALANTRPLRGNWLELERLLVTAFRNRPKSDGLRASLSNLWASVGRVREAAEIQLQIDLDKAPSPLPLYRRALLLWSANRLEEADRAMEHAYQLFPLHYAVWFSRFYLLLFNGRVPQAIAMAQDIEGRPIGIPDPNFSDILAVADAFQTREPSSVAAAVETQFDRAHTGTGHAENAATFVAALGRPDVAFEILNAYYFARGFVVPEVRFPGQQRFRTRLEDRFTAFLFMPPLARLRRDRRFDQLTRELGLQRYWLQSGRAMDAQLR